MEMVLQVLILAAGLTLLVKGADFFVAGASELAARLKIPQLIIGLTVVAMGTSAPEAAVSISGVIKGSADITVGNVLGSNILNVLIILGLSAVITPLAVGKSTIKYEIPFLTGITALMYVQGLDGEVSRIDGIVQLILFGLYLAYLIVSAKKSRDGNTEENKVKHKGWQLILLTLGGLGMIIFGSSLAVDSASAIALALGMSERFVGLTIVALGTSLPELFTSVTAARRGNADIAIGNIVGSNIFNILFVVGISSVIMPVPFSSAFGFDCIIAAASAVMLLLFCVIGKGGKMLKRWQGAVLLIGYAAYFGCII